MQLFWHEKKPYHNWMIFYFSFILLFVLFMIVMTTVAKEIVKEETTKANREAFSTMNHTVHVLKNDLDKIGVRVSLDKQIMEALQNQSGNRVLNQQNLRNAMGTISFHDQYISEILIYDTRQEMMVDGDGANRMLLSWREFLPEGVLPAEADYEAWKTFMEQPHTQKLYRLVGGDMMYLQSLPMGEAESDGVLICKVNAEQVERMFPNFDWEDDRELILLNEQGIAVYESRVHLLAEETVRELVRKGAGSTTVRQDGKKIVVFVSEDEAKLTCIYALSAGVYWSRLNSFLTVMILLAVLLTILGILLASILAKRQYTPIENILKLISGSASDAPRTDEFDYIQTTLRGILKSAKENEVLKQKYQNISFRSAFVKFLQGGNGTVQDLFYQYNIVCEEPMYAAALLSVNDFSDYFGTIDFDNENEQELMELAITNVFEEIVGEAYHVLAVRIDENMLFCLIGMREETYEDLRGRIKRAQEFTRERVGIYYSVSLSTAFADLQHLRQAYAQTMDLFICRHDPEREVLAYCDVNWGEGNREMTPETAHQLTESIYRGAEEEAKRLLRQILRQPEARTGSVRELKVLKYDLIGTFLKLLQAEQVRTDCSAEDVIQALEPCQTLEELYVRAQTLTETVCRSQRQMRQTKENTLSDKIMRYVQENYADADLNVNRLGDVFHLSSGHVSKMFKQQTGKILRDYILNIRLKNAELLLQSDFKLEEIARRCGFVDVGTFIRAFKKRYVITPGKYREQL